MEASVAISRKNGTLKLKIEIDISKQTSMLAYEQAILEAVNEVGNVATGECLKHFDSDGSPIEVAGIKLTSKGHVPKAYQTPYGKVTVARHVYQSPQGGKTFCPLDKDARIINTSTPRCAQMVSYKYACMNSLQAKRDLEINHGLPTSRCYLQNLTQDVHEIIASKGQNWRYSDPLQNQYVDTISVGIDGTCVLFCEEGYRHAMVGTISLYDILGNRLHTTYVGKEPEYGKQSFYQRMEQEISVYKKRYPSAQWVGVADGAKDQWPWIQKHTDLQILDFFHAAGYLEGAALAMVAQKKQREDWFHEKRRQLKEKRSGARDILNEMKSYVQDNPESKRGRKELKQAISYFSNNLKRMNYASYRKECLPIGSGVTEAACKTVVKQRMSGSGMKWKSTGAATILNLRSLILTEGRWEQFWQKISQFGI
jgi:hypothetical protein